MCNFSGFIRPDLRVQCFCRHDAQIFFESHNSLSLFQEKLGPNEDLSLGAIIYTPLDFHFYLFGDLLYAFVPYKVIWCLSDCKFNMPQLFTDNQIMKQANWSHAFARRADQMCGGVLICHTQDMHVHVWEREGK